MWPNPTDVHFFSPGVQPARRHSFLALRGDVVQLVRPIRHRFAVAILGDETFDVLKNGLARARRKLLDLAELTGEAFVLGGLALGDGGAAEELIDGEAEGIGDGSEKVRGRVRGLGFVVGDHAVGHAELRGEGLPRVHAGHPTQRKTRYIPARLSFGRRTSHWFSSGSTRLIVALNNPGEVLGTRH